MSIVVKRTGGDFVPCPAGTWPAVCVDVVDLGPMKSEWREEMVHKIRLVWQISERMPDGKPYLVSRMYTASLHEKSSLRKDLSSWRGQDFKSEELNGFDVENVLGVGCLLSVVQQPGNDGQPYSNVVAVMRLPNGYEAPRPESYVRVIHRPPDGMVSAPRSSQSFQQPQPFARRQAIAPPTILRGVPVPGLPPEPQPPGIRPAIFGGETEPGRNPAQPQTWANQARPVPQAHPEEVTDDDVPF